MERKPAVVVVPFVSPKSEQVEIPRPVMNQVIIRGSQAIGMGLTKTGVVGLLASTQMPTTNLIMTTLVTKQQGKTLVKVDGKYITQQEALEIEARKQSGGRKVKIVNRPTHPVAETKFMERITREKTAPGRISKKKSVGKRAAKLAVRGGSTSAIVMGRALPIMAYGYVGYSLLTGEDVTKEDVDRLVIGATVQEYKEMATTIKTGYTEATFWSGVAARTSITVGIGLLTGIFS